jgi:hypothetical protein
VLVDQPVEKLTLLDVAFVFQRRFSFQGGPGDMEQVSQLIAAWAIDVILKAALAEWNGL